MEDVQRPHRLAAYVLGWLRERAGFAEATATPLELLVDQLGLDVATFHPESRRSGTLGWLEPDEDLIYLREGLPDPVRRFTLAHELGHALLHRAGAMRALAGVMPAVLVDGEGAAEPLDCVDADLDAPVEALGAGEELLRPGEAYSARARRESEANAFASELLLPAGSLRAAYLAEISRRRSPGRGGDAIRAVARRFGVSEDVALRRLAALLTPSAESSEEPASSGHEGVVPPRSIALDAWQAAAAKSETPALVIAGPGTGKTSTLVGRVVYLVRERGVPPEQILALTFSNKAAREMSERLAAHLSPQSGEQVEFPTALVAPSLPYVATIHAFCGDLLRRYAPLVGLRPDFRLVTDTEGYLLLRQRIDDLDLRHYQSLAEPGLHFPTFLATISRAKDELAGPDEYAQATADLAVHATTPDETNAAERAREVALVYALYQAALADRGDVDFGDVIRLAVKLLQEQPSVLAEVRARHAHILVDEFQDINHAMGVLLQTLAGESGPLWAVGDADQAIYRFRGASPANLARFESMYRGAIMHRLRRNYRSLTPILDAAASVAGAFLDERHGEPLQAVRPAASRPAVYLASATDDADELSGLVRSIAGRLAEGRALADQAILCRTRRHAQQVAAALASAGIQAQLSAPLLEQELVKNVLGVFSLLAETSGSGLLRAGRIADHAFTAQDARVVLAQAHEHGQPPLALLRKGVEDIEGLSEVSPRGLAALVDIVFKLRSAHDLATALTRYVFGWTSLGGRILAGMARGEEQAADEASQLAELLTLARTFDELRGMALSTELTSGPRTGGLWADFFDYLRIVRRLRQEPGRAANEAADARDAVHVLTVHASKGLEFPIVYLPGLVERRFPMQRRAESAPLPSSLVGTAEDHEGAADAHLREEACLFYVAVTRARDEVVLSHAERYGRMRYKPSPFLAPIQQRLGASLLVESWERARAGERVAVGERRSDDAPLAEVAPVPSSSLRGMEPRPLRSAEVETYARCPRQYAYRYVYGLRPREAGLATLRRSLHMTLRELDARFGEAFRLGAVTPARANGDAVAGIPSLDEARQLFDAHWEATLAPETGVAEGGDGAQARGGEAGPFDGVYRRHGYDVVERSWRRLADQHVSATSPVGDVAEPRDAIPPDFERGVTVRVGEHAIAVTLDRVESLTAPAVAPVREKAAFPGRAASPESVVRHRLGRSSAPQTDLRTLFYTLAAEQVSGGAPATVQLHNLSTDERERIALSPRQRTRLTDELHEALDGIARADFAPRPEPGACENCPFLLICPA